MENNIFFLLSSAVLCKPRITKLQCSSVHMIGLDGRETSVCHLKL